jgi:bifunctional N-acetylglucosamine-1-phosphate-uridyltransferase/glucosamine-1-phosphate-acetyltransferase GlmU-like protein
MSNPLHVIILAAGEGKRMKSSLPKVLRKIAGRRMPDVLPYEATTPWFEAMVEATEDAIAKPMFRATTMSGQRSAIPALPLELV